MSDSETTTFADSLAEIKRFERSRLQEISLLKPLQLRRVIGILKDFPDQDITSIDAGYVLVWWTAEMLLHKDTISDPDQRWLLLEECAADIHHYGRCLSRAMEGRNPREAKGKLPVAYLGIADGQYAAITGRSNILDIKTGKWIPGTDREPLERVQYSLRTLFMGRYLAYEDRTPTESATC